MSSALLKAVDPILTLLYPPRCVVCRQLGEPTLCDRCLRGINPVAEPICARCGQSLDETAVCSHCTQRPPAFDRARAMGSYDGILRHAIHLLKYRDRPSLAEPLGAALAAYSASVSEELNHLNFDAILAVPMHPARQRVRGYNQSERLAQVLARQIVVPIESRILVRKRNTRAQVGLAQSARQANLAGAFAVGEGKDVADKVFLLVDDVSTTGSTLHECAKALKSAGASRIFGLTLAAG